MACSFHFPVSRLEGLEVPDDLANLPARSEVVWWVGETRDTSFKVTSLV